MPNSVKERLKKALIDAGVGELDDKMLDEVAGGNCSEGCYESCAACCTNGNANRAAEVQIG
jgi:hypothetical protein